MIKEKGKVRSGMNKLGRVGALLLVLGLGLVSGCFFPGLGSLGDASDPPATTDPSGVSDTFYGKFYIYRVGGSKYPISAIDGSKIEYIVNETYFPSIDIGKANDYNIMHNGDGTYSAPYNTMYGNTVVGQTMFYKDVEAERRPASSKPEAILLSPGMALYWTNHFYGYNYPAEMSNCGVTDFPNDLPETVPPPGGEEYLIVPTNYYMGLFQNIGGVPD
jgi:hypothetical protein